MKHGFLYLIAGLVLVMGAAASIWPQFSLFLASDSCLGAGGSFDFSRIRCDFQQSPPYVTFDIWPFWVAFVGSCVGAGLMARGLLRLRPNNSFKPRPLRGAD